MFEVIILKRLGLGQTTKIYCGAFTDEQVPHGQFSISAKSKIAKWKSDFCEKAPELSETSLWFEEKIQVQ